MNENKNTGADNVTAGKLPDGWKIYDKYRIRHADGTPLKGKRYFVLRLDSDDPSEAARVSAAMSAYKGEAQSGNAAKLREAVVLALSLLDLKEDVPYKTVSRKDIDFMKAALAAPARQCDVGTADEQKDRYIKFCDSHTKNHGNCISCPACNIRGRCEFNWAQMPYKKGGAK